MYDFKAEVANCDFAALRITNPQHPFSVSTSLAIKGTGFDVDALSGVATLMQTHLCYGDSVLFIPELRLTAAFTQEGRKVSFQSDVADFGITGRFKPTELIGGIMGQLAQSIPTFAERLATPLSEPQVYDFSLVYKAPNSITAVLVPGLQIARETHLYGSVNSETQRIRALLRSPEMAWGNTKATQFTLEAVKEKELTQAQLFVGKASAGGYPLENFNLTATAYDDLVQTKLSWLNAGEASRGDLDFTLHFESEQEKALALNRATLAAKGFSWQLADTATIWLKPDYIHIDTLALEREGRYVALAGKLGRDPSHQLHVAVSAFQLADLDSLGLKLDTRLEGLVNLDARISEVYAEPRLSANGTIAGLKVDGYRVGDITAYSQYQQEDKVLNLHIDLDRDGYEILDFNGTYAIGQPEPLLGEIILDRFNMQVLNILGLEDLTDFSGEANGRIQVQGTLTAPRLKGSVDFKDALVRIDYLNVFFRFSDRMRVEDGWFGIDYKPFFDQEGNRGFVVATIAHDNFSNWTYDVAATVQNMYVLNTTRAMNNVFFGTGRATGSFQLGQFGSILEINIDARTERGTSIKLPLDESGEETLESFVHFVSRNDPPSTDRTANLEDIQMRVNLEVTSDAEVQLIFDEQRGDIMRGRGEGLITLEMEPSGEFKMFGRYEIIEGNYLFTLRDLLNKQFAVRPGASIFWYGDPYQADININAVYTLRTPLFPIMVENRERYRGREDVNVVLQLTDKLMNPNIGFQIELPQSTENERSQLAGVVSTSQQLNQQVFALLILNRFLPSFQNQEQESGGGFSGLGAATTSDFVSTQISNWLSQISRDFDIGINYRPGDQISNQEVAVALSTQLFNERLAVRGNFGVTSNTQSQFTRSQSGILGDFLLEYMLTESGNIRLKVFNQTNPYEVFSTAGSMYTQGVGLIYQEDFNTVDEFLQRIGQLFGSKNQNKDVKATRR
jgi:hypothetical protein